MAAVIKKLLSLHRNYVLLALLGFGGSWTLADTIWSEMPIFVRFLPLGLVLPVATNVVAQTGTICTVIAYMFMRNRYGVPSRGRIRTMISTCLGMQLLSYMLLTAVCSRTATYMFMLSHLYFLELVLTVVSYSLEHLSVFFASCPFEQRPPPHTCIHTHIQQEHTRTSIVSPQSSCSFGLSLLTTFLGPFSSGFCWELQLVHMPRSSKQMESFRHDKRPYTDTRLQKTRAYN